MQEIMVPISVGELVDKVTILSIKNERIQDQAKLQNIQTELTALKSTCQAAAISLNDNLVKELRLVNEALWEVEDNLREAERLQKFDAQFIEWARSVYKHNDKRFTLKAELNKQYGSQLSEEKSYESY